MPVDFFLRVGSGFKILPRSEHASTVIECRLRFFLCGGAVGVKMLPRCCNFRLNGEGKDCLIFFMCR